MFEGQELQTEGAVRVFEEAARMLETCRANEKTNREGKEAAQKFLDYNLNPEFGEGILGGLWCTFKPGTRFDKAAWDKAVTNPSHPAHQAWKELTAAQAAYKVFTDAARKDPMYSSRAPKAKVRLPKASEL